MFQHTATRRWLPGNSVSGVDENGVSTHSHPKVAAFVAEDEEAEVPVSTHSHPKVAARRSVFRAAVDAVSTHSHPKVAAAIPPRFLLRILRFNTQPPEGGCVYIQRICLKIVSFNTQPPEGGCLLSGVGRETLMEFQHTATRRWLHRLALRRSVVQMFQHTATRRWLHAICSSKLAGRLFQHTATRRWLHLQTKSPRNGGQFQHTATRRWLRPNANGRFPRPHVSTHSHPKVAAASLKSLAPSGFAAPISLSFQEKREREYNTAFSVIPTFTIF